MTSPFTRLAGNSPLFLNTDQPAAAGVSALVQGTGASATGTNAIAYGTGTVGSGLQSTSVGFSADATGESSVALGANAEASALGAVAIGLDSEASAAEAVSIGRNSKAEGVGSIAILGTTDRDYSIVIGDQSIIADPNDGCIIIGTNRLATMSNQTIIGNVGTSNVTLTGIRVAADDAAAAALTPPVPVGGLYHNAGAVRIRLV